MGLWACLDRYEPAVFCRAVAGLGPDELFNELFDDRHATRSAFGRLDGIDISRAWHALHVALTGEAEGGPAPASHVIWSSPGASKVSMTAAHFLHTPETVDEITRYLGSLDVDHLVADLYAAIELGTYVYSFERWQGELDMAQSGAFQRAFARVRSFYDAARGQYVAVHRG